MSNLARLCPRSEQLIEEIVDDTELFTNVRRSERELDELQSEWTGLLEHSASNCVFLSWDWVRAWWSVYGSADELYVVEVRTADDTLVALAPLKIAKRLFGRRVVEFLGQGAGVTPEYLDFIVREGWRSVALPALLRRVLADSAVSGFDLRTIPSDSPNLQILRHMLPEFGPVTATEESRCPRINLPQTWEEFLASKSKNYRKKIKEYVRRCERDLQLGFRYTRTSLELAADLHALRRLHKARWGAKSRAFADADYVKFHDDFAQRLLEKDRLRLYLIEDGDRAIAALYCFQHGNTVYYYQSGRDPAYARYRLGLVVIHWAIRESIAEGFERFDLLTGIEEYKQRWATFCARNLRIRCDRRNIIERCVVVVRDNWYKLRAGYTP
jgi:CelD/BcsL family acetyltransferase involved in cellulose biosynthesis